MKKRLQKRFKDLQKKDKKGFTLIELIVVLVILGIVLAITVPAVTSYVNEAKEAKYLAQARSVFVVAEVEQAKVAAGLGGDVSNDNIKEKSGISTLTDFKVENKVGDSNVYTFTIDGHKYKAISNDKIESVE